tara:strand:- start:564 stop:1184 length:621 start_codon:yes stop_codon:yes gene_type:complete
MRLTKRDKEILQFINASGYCSAPQLGKRFSMQWWIVYRRMNQLIGAGLVIHKRINFSGFGIYFLTPIGARFTDLPPIDGISKGGFDHQALLVDLVLRLRDVYPEALWVSERHLKHQKFYYGVGKVGHVADGILTFPDGKKFAIELELTNKSNARLAKILRAYGAQFEIEAAWYFCADSVISPLSALCANKPYIKVHSLKEFMSEKF